MQTNIKKKLSNNIEVDETMIGGVDPVKKGRSKGKKKLVLVAVRQNILKKVKK